MQSAAHQPYFHCKRSPSMQAARCHRTFSPAAMVVVVLLLILAPVASQLHERASSVASNTSQQHEREPPLVVEAAAPSTATSVVEQHLAAVSALIAELQEMQPPVVVEAAAPSTATSAEPDDDVEPSRKTYVVWLETPTGGEDADAESARAWHLTFLPSPAALRYSYRTVFTGFAAWLTEEELDEVSKKPGFVRSYEDVIYTPDTTRTPAFLGLPNRMGESPDNWPGNGGRGVIIGIVDDGIDDTHPSLGDAGMEPRPDWWSGWCHSSIRCNNKLIGAKNMYENTPPRHDDPKRGHGTHVATIAAGNFVANVSFNGLASGVASGVAPYAHLAIYKVCGGPKSACDGSAVVMAFDEAVHDGVDVISLSFTTKLNPPYESSFISRASFNAMQNGVHVVSTAGNEGPGASSVLNTEPWVITVGASTVDRHFPAGHRVPGAPSR